MRDRRESRDGKARLDVRVDSEVEDHWGFHRPRGMRALFITIGRDDDASQGQHGPQLPPFLSAATSGEDEPSMEKVVHWL